jgi:hypothetical protein
MAFEIKKNDRRPKWRVQLTANALPVNLTGNSGVKFTMAATAVATPKVNKQAMTVVDATTGIVEYAWGVSDTDTAGDFLVEVEVDWGGGETQSFPSKGYFAVTVEDDLA